nr:hypothetical protein [Pandoravirus aubagnensis]
MSSGGTATRVTSRTLLASLMTNLIQCAQRRRLEQRNGNAAASIRRVGVTYMPDVEGDVVGVDNGDNNDCDEDIKDIEDDDDDDDKDGLDEKESAFVWRGCANGKADDETYACDHVAPSVRNVEGDSGGDGLLIVEGDVGGDDVGDADDVDRDDDREIDEQESDDDKESDDRVWRGDAVRTERAEVNGDAQCAVEPSLSLRSVRCDLAHAAKLRHTDRGERMTSDDDRAALGCRTDVGDALVSLPSIDDEPCVLCQRMCIVGGGVRSHALCSCGCRRGVHGRGRDGEPAQERRVRESKRKKK